MDKMPHIAVFKGYEGFADRLQVLSHCIHYCVNNNAVLCIDWRDMMWGQGVLDFSDYFEIINLKTIQLNEVVTYLKNGATITPTNITPELLEDTPDSISNKYYGLSDSDLRDITKSVNSNIVVFNCKGFRNYHIYTLTNYIRLKDNILEVVKSKLQNISIPFSMIHLRGTDRMENNTVESLIKIYEDKFNSSPPHAKVNLYVISDSKQLVDKWLEKYPASKVLQENSSVFRLELAGLKEATHKQIPEILEFYNVTKHELNIDTITEFIALSFASYVIGNEKSTFYKMSRFIYNNGNISSSISNWLNNWTPPRKSIK